MSQPNRDDLSEPVTAVPPGDEQVAARADLLPEEQAVGSEDPVGQAATILAESEQRIEDAVERREQVGEHRSSDETVEP